MANNTEIMQWLISRIDEIEQKRESLTKDRFYREFNPRLRELKHLIEECADGKCPNENSGLHLQNVSNNEVAGCPKCKGDANGYISGFRTYCDRCNGTGQTDC